MQPYKIARCGSADSKYFSNPNQFDLDIKKSKFDSELFKAEIRKLVLQEPSRIKQRYNEAIKVMIEIKTEYGL